MRVGLEGGLIDDVTFQRGRAHQRNAGRKWTSMVPLKFFMM